MFEGLHKLMLACVQQLDLLHALCRAYYKKYGSIEMSYSISFKDVFNLSTISRNALADEIILK